MSINVDWLGDGWTYYSNEERRQMEAKGKKSDADRRRHAQLKHLAAECVAWSCVPVPLQLAKKLLAAMRVCDLSEQEQLDVSGLVTDFDGMIREVNAMNHNYPNN